MKRVYFNTGFGIMLAAMGAPPASAEDGSDADSDKIIVEDSRAPASAVGEDVMEPEVTIIETTRGTIQEYRAGGRLYMVKITPRRGVPYYLVDTDGDGYMDMRHNDPTDITIQQWPIYSW